MAPVDLSSILKNYEGKWVALSDDNRSVFGSGNTAKDAANEAKTKGRTDFTLLFVQPFDLLYCGQLISLMKVPYKAIGPQDPAIVKVFPENRLIFRPIITIALQYQNTKEKFSALVDSGADACLFPKDVAEVLGIDIKLGPRTFFTGIAGGQIPFYFHEVDLFVGEHQIKSKMGFSTSSIGTTGILGHQGFFDQFVIAFDTKNKFVEIKKHGLIEGLTAKLNF